jgi:hypothetical protein
MLKTKKRFSEKYYLKLPNYTAYHRNHPVGTTRGGTAVIIKNCIKHHQLNIHRKDFLLATNVLVE